MSEYEYWDIYSGDGLSDSDLHERYDDMLDEITGEVSIGNLTYSASYTLQNVDPVAYRVGFNDWLDSELGETITDEQPEEEE